MEKQKRQRNRPKLRYSGESDIYSNGGNVSRNGASSSATKHKSGSGYGHSNAVVSSKRHKYEGSMKMETAACDVESSPPNNSVARIEIDAGSSDAVASRHYSDVDNFIKVEVDEEQREAVVSSVNSSSEVHSPHEDSVISPVKNSSYQGSQQSSGHFVYVERSSVPPVQQHHVPQHQSHYPSIVSASVGGPENDDVLPPQSLPHRNSEVPILKKEDGPFRFTVELDKEDTNKTPSWLMSTKNKLYTNINKAVPFHVKLEHWPPDERRYQVRVTAVFSSHQYARAHVKRCPIHATPTHQTNIDFPYPDHVVRLDHPSACYEKNSSGRLSVVVPLEQPQTGPLGETMPLLLRFMCLCSCSGGINRRPLAIIFTLEKLSNSATDYQQDDDQIKFEDDALQASRDIALVERMEVQQRQPQLPQQMVYSENPSLPRYNSSNQARVMNGHSRLGNIIINSGNNGTPVARITNVNSGVMSPPVEGYSRMANYSNSGNRQEVELIEGDYIVDGPDHTQSLSRSCSSGGGSLQTLTSNSNSTGSNSFSHQPVRSQHMQQQQHLQQPVTVIAQDQIREINSVGTPATLQIASDNLNSSSGISNFVTHQHPILGSLKSTQRATISGSIVQNGSSNQPVLLIYNPSGVDDQLVQTLNARKILLPKMEAPASSQNSAFVRTSSSNSVVNMTVQAENTDSSSDNSSMCAPMEESTEDSSMQNGGNGRQATTDVPSTSVSLAVLKRSLSSDIDDQSSSGNSKQFRHIPISAVAQAPVRDPRKSLCVPKKMPLLKPIAGKVVSQPSSLPSGTVSVTLPVSSHQQHPMGSMILTTQSAGGNQVFLTRGPSTHIILPVSSQPQNMDVKAMSSVFPNMSVVKRELVDDERKRDDDLNCSRKSYSVSSPYSVASISNHVSESSNVVYSMTGNGRLTASIITSAASDTVTGKCSSSMMNNGNDGQLSAMNGQPDSAELLAAQVLASSLGSRQIAVSGASGTSMGVDSSSDCGAT
ncbi:p53 DNA-binding domain [Trinorchestia longiramus]|nr:p53 DNA-binding domain [Trinorchestia longiramus]